MIEAAANHGDEFLIPLGKPAQIFQRLLFAESTGESGRRIGNDGRRYRFVHQSLHGIHAQLAQHFRYLGVVGSDMTRDKFIVVFQIIP